MSESISISFDFKPARGRNGKRTAEKPPELRKGNIPRVSRLLALAHHFEELRREGVVEDYADLARLGGVTRARITQIMSLLNLAPEIQEEILFLPVTTMGRDLVGLKSLVGLSQAPNWEAQRRAWKVPSAG